ncbi:MAG TPA: alpha/beta hydrolase family protein [Kofleriaceae bacterium]|nr:alpha/beta hydrolase family protein [Kofleriaceae bacterium]
MKRLIVLLAACSKPSAPAPQAEPPTPAAKPVAGGPHGKVVTQRFHSDALGVDKAYVAYLPADYDAKPTTRWPVFYYLHGLTGSEVDWTHGGHLDQVADQLALGAIVVMPDGDDNFYIDGVAQPDYDACMRDGSGLFAFAARKPAETCVRHANYETYIVHDLIAEVDARFRTIGKREGRAIAGLSMGGFGALELAMRHRELFAAAASHSGVDALLYAGPHPYVAGKVSLVTDPKAWGAAVENIGKWVRPIFGPDLQNWKDHDPAQLASTLQPGQLALYLDCGTEDGFALEDQASYLHDILTERHIDHAFFLGPGGHNFGFWGPRLPESLKFLRDHTAKPQS